MLTSSAAAIEPAAQLHTIKGPQASPPLFGREWLAAELDQHMSTHTSGYVFLEGDAGVGKTTFLSALVQQRRYLAHFIRQGDARSTAEAVRRSLASQVLDALELDDRVRDEPSRTWNPEKFANLLESAATQLTSQSHLVIVIDAIDESDLSPESLPLGLPPILPQNVFVVLSYRTGTRFYRPPGATTLTIGIDEPRNLLDVQRFLEQEVTKADIAVALDASEVSAECFIDQLTQRCRGVWVYLHYILVEIRQRQRRADDLDSLPETLTDYYMINLMSAEHTPDWDTVHLPVLSTLAVVAMPLPMPTIARLAGVTDLSAVQSLCDFIWRPFLSVTGENDRHYMIYHESLREFVRGSIPNRPHYDGLRRIRSQLRVANRAAHDRCARIVLEELGGLEAGLPGLAPESRSEVEDSVGQLYALTHLPTHLEVAGRVDELHNLLTCTTKSPTGEELNLWFDAHDRAGTLDNYLNDLDRARRAAETRTDEQLRGCEPASALGLETYYALLAASVNSSNNKLPANLLAELVNHDVWDLDRAVAHARDLFRPSQRFKALLLLLPYGSVNQQRTVLTIASAAAAEIRDDRAHAAALAQLAPLLGSAGWSKAISAVEKICDEDHRSNELIRLAPTLPSDLVETCLTIASKLQSPYARYRALTAVAVHLNESYQAEVMMEAYTAAMDRLDEHTSVALETMAPLLPHRAHSAALTAIAGWQERSRSFALKALAPSLPDDLLASGLALADTLSDPEDSARALTALAARPMPARDAVLTRALTAARSIHDPEDRAEALADLAGHLPPRQRTAAVSEALTAVRAMIADPDQHTWDREYDQQRTLNRVIAVPQLPSSVVNAALDIATEIKNYVARERALIALAPILPRRLLRQAIDAASPTQRRIGPNALIALSERLPANLLNRAIIAATKFDMPHSVSTALRHLARHLPDGRRDQVHEQALAAARAVPASSARADALEELATCLAPEMAHAVLDEALQAVLEIGHSGARYSALMKLLPRVRTELRPQLLRQALATVRRIHDGSRLAKTLTTLTTHMGPDAARVIQAAHDAARRITDETEHANTLTTVALAQSEAQQSAVVTEALDAVAAIPDILRNRTVVIVHRPGSERAEALLRLVQLLSDDQLKRARMIAANIPDQQARIEALIGLAGYLQADSLSTIVDTVLDASDELIQPLLPDRLTALAPHLPPHLLSVALDASLRVKWDFRRAQCIAALAPSLSTDLLPRALDAALSIADDASRTIALAPLILKVTPRPRAVQLATTLDSTTLAKEAASTFHDDAADNKWRTLIQVMRLLPPDRRINAFPDALSTISETCLFNAHTETMVELARLAEKKPRIKALDSAIARATRLNDPANRARSLANLVPMLTAEQTRNVIIDILDAIEMSTDETAIFALRTVAPYVTDNLAERACTLAEAASDDWQRGMALLELAPILPDHLCLRAAQLLMHTEYPSIAGQIVHNKQHGAWPPDTLVTFLRSGLRHSQRATVVFAIEAFAPAITRIGGRLAWREIANGINQSYLWWP